ALVLCAVLTACAGDPAPSASSVRPASSGAVSAASQTSSSAEEAPVIHLCHLTNLDLVAPATRTYIENNLAQYPIDYEIGETYRTMTAKKGAGTLSWDYDNVRVAYVNLVLGRQPDLSDGVSYLCDANTFEPENLIPDTTYYWQIVAETTEGGTVRSEIASFTTEPGVRPIAIGGVGNARDLGGWKTEDGLTLNYGLVYRTAKLTDVTAEGVRTAVDVLGIKTEIDLRGSEGLADCPETGVGPLGKDVAYLNFAASSYKTGISSSVTPKQLRVFCDPANYPITFHCAAGADRAGTLAALLEGICGCGPTVLLTDYELTNGRYRTYEGFEVFLTTLESASGATFREKVWTVLRKRGMTPMELSNIRSLMTGEGAVFAADSLTRAATVGDTRTLTLDLRQSKSITAVTLDGASVSYTFKNSVLTLSATSGEGTITFDDGTTLWFVL
ncbi:MAG: tyrosine-protein phosphatase, partial [Clostridia bacterium]|nr:tyrosine-protein phosphatase [Clostridia bacterium]